MAPRTPSHDYSQLGMTFELPARTPHFEAGSLDIAQQLRGALSTALKHAPQSRAIVAGRMSELTASDISKSMLDAWTADSKEGHRFPLEYFPALEVATGTTVVTELLGKVRGFEPMFGEVAVFARIAQLEHIEEIARNERLALKKIAGGRR